MLSKQFLKTLKALPNYQDDKVLNSLIDQYTALDLLKPNQPLGQGQTDLVALIFSDHSIFIKADGSFDALNKEEAQFFTLRVMTEMPNDVFDKLIESIYKNASPHEKDTFDIITSLRKIKARNNE